MTRKAKSLPPVPLAPLRKVLTGITGFDEITNGGLPVGRTILVRGGPGCGKTVFAMQVLVNRARDHREAGILVAFEERADQIVANAATLGWNIPALAAKKLFFVDANLSSRVDAAAEIDLTKELNLLRAYVREAGAKYIVFDGIDVLLRSLADPQAELREIYRLREWILESGLTAIITQKSGLSDDDTKQGL
jgi:circadian clock protein KaiC